jgi:DNA-binding FrmR family transcriptional regulator
VDHEHTHPHDHVHLPDQSVPHSHGGAHPHIHENSKAVINRMARIIGHLESIKRMVEEGRDCSEVLVQIAAVKSVINNVGKVVLQDHIRHCIMDAVEDNDSQAIDELCEAVNKFMK